MSEAWQESDSKVFADLGRIYTPNRDEIEATILQLIPARPDERFWCVDVGAGEGWLSQRVLQRFNGAQVIALDGSPTMLARARERLAPYGQRAVVREFKLESDAWIAPLPGGVRCFLSSIVLHHLDPEARWTLFRNLYRRLEPGGALLMADLIAPSSEAERDYARSEEHTSELQSRRDLVCRLLLEKKKKKLFMAMKNTQKKNIIKVTKT